MGYFAPYIDSTGFHIPTYNDINNYLLANYTSIVGQSTSLNLATSDVQTIAIFALMINDAFQAAQVAYNGMMPGTAVGAQQDSLYKLNGISRNPATASTCPVVVSGTANATLNNLVAQDTNGNLWNLPASVTIGSGGTVTVTATCQTLGDITAAVGTINIMNNPQANWTGVNNLVAATPGAPVESDSAFRARQALSVALPSQTEVTSTIAAIAATAGVTRYGITGVENPTGGVDSYGNPAHSISMVVEGGTDLAVATAIYNNKTPGCLTNGTTTVNVTDPITGTVMPISFFRPSYIPIYVTLNVHGLSNFTTATQTAIQTAIVNYLQGLQIGELVTISGLYAAAMAVMPSILAPQFSIHSLYAGTTASPTGTTDISINFNQVAQGITANVVVNTV